MSASYLFCSRTFRAIASWVICWESRSGRRNLPPVLSHVVAGPVSFRSQDVHPPAVRVIAPAEIAPWVVAVGVGIAETDDVHSVLSLPFGE